MSLDTGDGRSTVERALDLVDRGWSYRRIARHLGIGKSTVGAYVSGEYGGDEVHVKREHLRGLELARLDRVIRRLDRVLMSKDDEVAVKAGGVLVKASESRRKLLGLDAPTKTQEVSSEKTPVRELVASVLSDEDVRAEVLEQLKGAVH